MEVRGPQRQEGGSSRHLCPGGQKWQLQKVKDEIQVKTGRITNIIIV